MPVEYGPSSSTAVFVIRKLFVNARSTLYTITRPEKTNSDISQVQRSVYPFRRTFSSLRREWWYSGPENDTKASAVALPADANMNDV